MMLENPDTQYDVTEPRDRTAHELEEHHEMETGDHEFEPKVVMKNKGETIEVTVTCVHCSHVEATETYLLHYAERFEDGERFGRDENPTCTCDESDEEGEFFQIIRYARDGENTVFGKTQCAWCGKKFQDVFKHQHTN